MIQDTIRWLANNNAEARELYEEVILHNGYGITQEICKNKDFIDIGANMGMFSIYASMLGASKVIAVEPISTTVAMLNANIKQANIDNVIVRQNIVSNVANKLIKIGLQDTCGHNSVYSPSDKFEEIKTTTLKELLDLVNTNNVFLKIDCEGGEYDILLNADANDMARISTVAIEIHADLHPTYKGAWHIHKALYAFGFKPIQQHQMKVWDVDWRGNAVNIRDLPTSKEIWVRHE